ncbi:MAG: hypothetical protein V3T82_07915 [Nitrospinaceae bacterium]
MTDLATAATIASTVFSAVSAVSQGSAQKRLSERNAQIADQQAAQIKEEARFEESRKRSEIQRLKGVQRARQGASGGGVDTGSNLLVLEETAVQGELDALTIRYRGTVQAGRARAQAVTDRFQGDVARRAGIQKAGTSLLTGATRVAKIRADNKAAKE